MKLMGLLGAALLLCLSTGDAGTVAEQPPAAQAQKWLDFIEEGNSPPFDESFETELPGFPGVSLRWTAYDVTAVSGTEETVLIQGWPVNSVYLCDLTGDGLPEVCSSVFIGFGMIDERIYVYDYAKRASYELSDRGFYDYRLTMQDGALWAVQSKYIGEETARGRLALTSDGEGFRLSIQKES